MKWIVALAGFITLGLLGITYDGFARISGGSGAKTIENKLQISATSALRNADMGWASVKISGQMAYLSGIAPSKAERDKARDVILRGTWHGGVVLGGITAVRLNQVQIAVPEPPASPVIAVEQVAPSEVLPEPENVPETEDASDGKTIDDVDQCQLLFAGVLANNTIHFETSKAEITPDSFALLDSLAQMATRCSAFSLLVTGHTDWLGDPHFNNLLSAQRARAVRDYLIVKNVQETKITSRGVGSREPVCQENTRSCRKQNRRIEITVE